MVIYIESRPLNVPLLHAELQFALSDKFVGIATSDGIRIHMTDDTTNEDEAQVHVIVQNHDETELTNEQNYKRQQQETINQGRAFYAIRIDSGDITLKELAERVAWLEEEVRQSQGI